MQDVSWLKEYQALTQGAGLVDTAECTQIEFLGEDRASFLHNLCTNEVRKLPENGGCEAFITNVQGKTLGHVFIFRSDDLHVVQTVPGQGDLLRQHFEKYLIRERVEIKDRSTGWGQWLLLGKQAEDVLSRTLAKGELPTANLSSSIALISHTPIWIRRTDCLGDIGFMIDCLRGDHAHVGTSLKAAGAVDCSHAAYDALRIEAGFPLFGHDITAQNLPQEVSRNNQTISFTKGCYLGQETVARIDALGHVNRNLVRLRFLGSQVPPIGANLLSEDDSVGTVTSAAWSPHFQSPMALGYVRRGFNTPGTRLTFAADVSEVEVMPLVSA